MRWRRASRSELSEPGAEVSYDWPEGGGAPFDVSDDATRWVLVAGSRFGRTWPAGDRLDFGSWAPGFEGRVPMGSKESSGTYAALDGNGGERGPDGRWVSHQHDGYAGALAEARRMGDRRALVVRLLETKDWH